MVTPEERLYYMPLNDRPIIRWPNNARVAFWVIPNVEFWEYRRTAAAPLGGATNPTPFVHGYALRDYGNRVGFWRMLDSLDKYKIRCTVNLNFALLDHHPELIEAMQERGYEFCCHGFYNTRTEDPSLMTEEEEREWLQENIDLLKKKTGQQLYGFNVLTRCSLRTPDLLAEAGLTYHADWHHDDQPTPIRVRSGKKLVSVPYSMELNDALLLGFQFGRPFEGDYFVRTCKENFDRLYEEGAKNGTVYCLVLHPYTMGFPYRIKYQDQILEYIMSHDGVWQATAAEIADYYTANYYDEAVAHCERLAGAKA